MTEEKQAYTGDYTRDYERNYKGISNKFPNVYEFIKDHSPVPTTDACEYLTSKFLHHLKVQLGDDVLDNSSEADHWPVVCALMETLGPLEEFCFASNYICDAFGEYVDKNKDVIDAIIADYK